MMNLVELKCTSYGEKDIPLDAAQSKKLLEQIPNWKIIIRNGIETLERVYLFKNFVLSLSFANSVGEMAAFEKHYPILLVEWGKTTIWYSSREVKGLHINDFILAAKADHNYEKSSK